MNEAKTEKETDVASDEMGGRIYSNIFKVKNIKKGWKKNTNVPKFLVRVYLKYFSKFKE